MILAKNLDLDRTMNRAISLHDQNATTLREWMQSAAGHPDRFEEMVSLSNLLSPDFKGQISALPQSTLQLMRRLAAFGFMQVALDSRHALESEIDERLQGG